MENIRTLDAIQSMRLRPHMYIGKDHERTVNTLVQAVVEELLEVGGRHFIITLGADGFTTVAGNDSGILAEDATMIGKTASRIERALTEARTGTGYGMEISLTNAFSEQLEVKISRNGSVWEQNYQRGIPQCALHKTGVREEQGTSIRFLPDKEFFIIAEFRCDQLVEHLCGRAKWYEGRISGPRPQGFYEQTAFKKAAQYRDARFSITDEREIDLNTGKPRHIEF